MSSVAVHLAHTVLVPHCCSELLQHWVTGGVPREQQWWPHWFRYPQLVLELHDHELNYDLVHGIAMIVESAEHLVRKLLTIMRLAAPIERLPEFDGDATMLWEQACAGKLPVIHGCLLPADTIVRCSVSVAPLWAAWSSTPRAVCVPAAPR